MTGGLCPDTISKGGLRAQISGKGVGRSPTNFGVKKLDFLGYHVVLFV